MFDADIIEKLLRNEVKLNGGRWNKGLAEMGTARQADYLGKMIVRRLVSEEINRQCQSKEEPEPEIKCLDSDLRGTQGPLGNGTGGVNRVLRGTNSLS